MEQRWTCDGHAMDKRWTSDGAAAKEKRNQSEGKVGSNLMFPKVLHDERQKKGFPRKAKGDFLGGIVFFVYLCTQKQIEHKGTKTQSLYLSGSASLRLTKTKGR